MINYTPLNFNQINATAGSYNPSMVKAYNNEAFIYWERSLLHRALSVIDFTLPEEWQENSVKDFFKMIISRNGFVGVWEAPQEGGLIFNPGTLTGYNIYYQPTHFICANPAFSAGENSKVLEIGKDVELLKLTPDYIGIWDTITYYAEKLAVLDNAINVSLINNKFSYILGAKNKGAAEALKKMLDKVNKGEPAVIYDSRILDDTQTKDTPFQFLEKNDLKNNYITTDQLQDFATILNMFDAEIGIPSVPYQKKERMVADEAISRQTDAISRLTTWIECFNESAKTVNNHFGTDISAKMHFEQEGGNENVNNEDDRLRIEPLS